MNQRVKNTINGTLVFGIIGFVVTYILNGRSVWPHVAGQAIAGFIFRAWEERKKRSKGDSDEQT